MARQNRVTPFGTIVRPPEGCAGRGDFFGNRGCLHDSDGRLRGRPWRSRAWITCRLAFKGRHRTLMMPGRYTELFFLDEATALAAGHRPCGECRWHDYQRFRRCWPALLGQPVAAVDHVLQAERVDRQGRQLTHDLPTEPLPNGSMVAPIDQAGRPCLVWDGRLYPWSLDGYGAPVSWPAANGLRLLTPPALVAVLARGYRIAVHASGPAAGLG
jgi:hypothetical protein